MQQPEQAMTGLADAAQRRSEHAHNRARNAIRRLQHAAKPVSFQSVAREAGVSRQFLYTHPQLRGEIDRLRAAHLGAADAVAPAERSSEASLKARNQTLLNENRRLRQELDGLREELAGAWGDLRALQRQRRRTGSSLEP